MEDNNVPTTSNNTSSCTTLPISKDIVDSSTDNEEPFDSPIRRKQKWSDEEQQKIFCHFGQKVLEKILPKRSEIVQFKAENSTFFEHRSIDQIQMFVRNHVLRAQRNVTPKVNRFLIKPHPYNSCKRHINL